MLTKEQIERGMDRNILVFDCESKEEKYVSRRLASIMVDVYIHNRQNQQEAQLDTLWVPAECEVEGADMPTLAGLTIRHTSKLNRDGPLFKYYTSTLNGTLASGDTFLIVGTDRGVGVLLGSCK